MKEKSSFVLYHDIRTPLELLNDEDRGKLFIFNETIRACGHSGAAGRTGGGNEAWIRKESHGG